MMSILRILLWLLPSDFREEYGEELLHTAHDHWLEKRATLSLTGRFRFWLRQWFATIRVGVGLRRGRGLIGGADRPVRRRLHGAWAGESIFTDLRYAFRVLAQAKAWTAVILVSLALGIGANTALFSAVNGLLLRTIPVADPEGLVRLRWAGENHLATSRNEYGTVAKTAAGERASSTFSYSIFEELSGSNATLTGLFACAPRGSLNVVVGGQAESASGLLVSGDYFDVLGIHARVGRVLDEQDDHVTASPVVVISHGFWRRRFGRNPGVVGKTVTVNNTPVTIVGVLPPEYTGVQSPLQDAPDIHLPLALDALLDEETRLGRPTYWWLQIMGRMKPGVRRNKCAAISKVSSRQQRRRGWTPTSRA